MIKKIFSTRVRELRKAAGLTQPQLAEAIGLTRGDINHMESGTQFTGPEKFVSIADFFHVTTDYLLGRSDDPHNTNLDPLARTA